MMINISQTPEILRNNMEILVLRAFQLTETQTRSLALSHGLSLSCSLALFSLTLCPPISLFLTHTRFCYPLQKLWKSSLSQNALRQYNPLTRLILSLPTSAIKTTTTTTIIIIIKTNLWNNHPTNQATNQPNYKKNNPKSIRIFRLIPRKFCPHRKLCLAAVVDGGERSLKWKLDKCRPRQSFRLCAATHCWRSLLPVAGAS